MKIAFLYWGYENPGIEALSAILKKSGHEVSLFFDPALFNTFHVMDNRLKNFFDSTEKSICDLINSNPDLIGISALSDDYDWACGVAKRIKEKSDTPIIFGGKHPTAVPEKVIKNDFVDYVCVGEGDDAVLELANKFEAGQKIENISNIWRKENGAIISSPLRPLIGNLDKLPFADKDIFYNEYKGFSNIYTISTSRGCPNACSYCHNNLVRHIYQKNGPYLRRRSVDNVIAELVKAKLKYNLKRIYFLDEIFIYDVVWLREFVVKYKNEVALPFGCELFASYVNVEVVSLLVDAGCLAIDMGIQTISENLRRDVLLRSETNDEIKNAITLLRKTKIFIYIGIMLGIPGQDEKEVLAIARFLNENKPDMVLTSWLRYYPRTEMIEIARRKGNLTKEDIVAIEAGGGFSPFVREGHTFDQTLGKIAHLIILSPFIARWIMDLLIKYKVYSCFPRKTFLHLNCNSLIGTWYKRLFCGRKKLLYFTVFGQLRFMLVYMIRTLKAVFNCRI